jgi:hypothetical protein
LSFLLKLLRHDAFFLRFVKSILAAYHKQITKVLNSVTFSSQDDDLDHSNITALHGDHLFHQPDANS